MDPQQPTPTPPNPVPEPAPQIAPAAPNPASVPLPAAGPAPAAPAPVVPTTPTPLNPYASALPNVPETWPGAWGAYKYSKQAVKRNWGVLLGLWVLSYVLSFALEIAFKQAGRILSSVLSLILTATIIKATFASVRGQKVSFGDSFAALNPLTVLKLLVNYIVLSVILICAFIVLIVPFAILFPRLVFAPYLVVDRNLGPFKALGASWDMSKGHSGKVWGIICASIAMALLMFTIIGIPFALYFLFMYSAAFIVLCEYTTTKNVTAPSTIGAMPSVASDTVPQVPAV